ncbi:hypothetical protein ACFL15_01965 [Patescibacteria group bacterium]
MKIRISSFIIPPLPKEVYRDKSVKHQDGSYQNIVHAAIKGFYRIGSINEGIWRVEKKSKEILKT